jgi:2-polyprenyl-6-methoxyphenol hydroxylase-like FAD-dependent oxidoreductase
MPVSADPAAPVLRVAVTGGSLGGLITALWLLEAGCDVHVYERSASELSSRGAGIVVQPETVDYLRTHGTSIDEISTSTTSRIYLSAAGTVLQTMPGEQRFTSWNTLYRHLLGKLDPARYHLGKEVTRLRQDLEQATLTFADGSTTQVELVVAADGPRSTLRTQLLPGTDARYAGYVAWRGLVSERDLDPEIGKVFADTFVFAELRRTHALCYPIPGPDGQLTPGERHLNWIWYRNITARALPALLTDRFDTVRHSLAPGFTPAAQIEHLRQDATAHLPPVFAALAAATAEPFLQPVMDLSVPRMAFGRVALLGDAAFVVRPHTAGSTMKAAHNGKALATAIARHSTDVSAALATWEREQLLLGRQLHRSGQALAARSGLG